MDLDLDELRATRILNGVEKTADKMFEELGYIVEEGKINVFIGRGEKDESFSNDFVIHKKSKSITIYKMLVSMQELKAINKKCEELGWKE